MIRIPSSRWALPFLALGVIAVAGCDDDDDDNGGVGPQGGTLNVTVTATGEPADPDGFTLLLNGSQIGQAIPATGGTHTEEGLDAGDYELELDGLAANCTVDGENPRTVTITDDETTTETFTVTCSAATNTLTITTATTGTNPDADGYTVAVNEGAAQPIAANGTLELNDVPAGDVSVLLDGIAANCAVSGDNPATVTVVQGTPGTHTFTVTCAANTGNATVTTTTTGANLDPDGYTLTVDAGTPINIGVNETVTVPGLTAGDHDFQLGGVAANCTVTGGVDQAVTIQDQQTATVDYAITCS